MQPILSTMLDTSKRGFVSVKSAARVLNRILEENFLARQQQLMASGAPSESIYAFFALPNGENGDVSRIFSNY